MRKIRKCLILALMLDALAVFGMQVAKWRGAWIFVALYWALLTALNYCNWKAENAYARG